MNIHLTSTLDARVVLPTSKSISARALIINALAEEACELVALSDCDDTQAMLSALSGHSSSTIDIGAAGTAMRFLTAYFATREGETHLLTGTPRMLQRPIGILVDALRSLGADIEYVGAEGYPPLRIHGRRLRGGTVSVEASVSSQYISALLMVGPTLAQGLQLQLEGEVASLPYVNMTLQLMRQFGAAPTFDGHTVCVPAARYHRTAPYTVEPDWSAASYWYELVALAPDAAARVVLAGLPEHSLQGDSVCADYFTHLGVATSFTPEGAVLTKMPTESRVVTSALATADAGSASVEIAHKAADAGSASAESGSASVNPTAASAETSSASANSTAASPNPPSTPVAPVPLRLDFRHCPDLAQTFVVTAALMRRAFEFEGLRSLRIKETDRSAALSTELRKLGISIREVGDERLVYDGAPPTPPVASEDGAAQPISIATYADHRMAMAFAPAAYLHPGLHIEHPEVVSKSYPQFWEQLPTV